MLQILCGEKMVVSPTEGKQWSEQHEPVLVVYYPSGYHLMTDCPIGSLFCGLLSHWLFALVVYCPSDY